MTRTLLTLTTLAALLSSAMTLAQTRPDFSGSWVVDDALSSVPVAPPVPPPGPGLPPPPAPPRPTQLVIRQTADELNIDRTMSTGQATAHYKTRYSLAGTETTNQLGEIVTKSKLTWHGSKLLFANSNFAGETLLGDSKETYSLENDRLVVDVVRNAPRGTIQSRLVYRRKS